MAKKYNWLPTILFILPLVLALSGCGEQFGKVDQGRTIAFDKTKKTLTIIKDSGKDPNAPDYSVLPPVTYTLPENPHEMGPEPKIGKRMKLDTKTRQIVIYVPETSSFASIDYTLVDQKENLSGTDPLVYNEAEKKDKKFPVIDKAKKTITIYSKRLKTLTTLSVPDQYFSLPEDTWDNGDEMRIYFKQEGKASRIMNVSKTDIYKK
jgi:hypothetical protein